MTRALVVVVLAACSIQSIDYTGKECPCPDGYRCDALSQTCARNESTSGDAAPRGDGLSGGDGAVVTDSCFPSALSSPLDALSTFASFPSGWGLVTGQWTKTANDAHQTGSAALAWVYRQLATPTSDYRVVVKMHAPEPNAGAIGVAFRVAGSQMYHCTYDPESGVFELNLSQGLQDTLLASVLLPTIVPNDTPFTMEIMTVGTQHVCCVRNFKNANQLLYIDDGSFRSGNPGIVTRNGSGRFSSFHAYE